MQIFRSALVLLFPFASTLSTFAAAPKVHTVGLGGARRVPFVAADVAKEDKADESKTLKIRPLIVDDKQKEWTTGDLHDVTDRSFVIQRALHVNDTLPGEKSSRWTWQPGPWLLVDRISGHISALHLPDFDASISDVVWYRDYAAYCGVKTTVRNGGLVADTWQIGARKAAVSHLLGKWPQPDHLRPICTPAKWQREPMRVTMQLTSGTPITFDIVGTSAALIEDTSDDDQ